MPSYKVTFAKIVGSPTHTHWSQVYSAGSLHAVLSLVKEDEEKELSLNVAGKGILNNIEAEFFTLEDKNLQHIKEAIQNALSSTSEDIIVSLAFGYLRDDVMYLFTVGNANALVKRDGQTAVLLKGAKEKKATREIHASSGFVRENDVFLLYTHAFETHVSEKAITEALAMDSLADAEEELTPHVHDKEAGDAAAIFVQIGASTVPATDEPEEAQEPEDTDEVAAPEEEMKKELPEKEEEPTLVPGEAPLRAESSNRPSYVTNRYEDDEEPEDIKGEADNPTRPRFSIPSFTIPNKKALILIVAIVLALALGGGIYSVKQGREQQKVHAEFQSVYDEAMKDYEVGESLEELNKAVAQDNFIKAQKTIEEKKGKFKEGSEERKKLDELLAKIHEKVGGSGSAKAADTKEVDDGASPILAILKKTGASYATKGSSDYFYLTEKAVIRTDDSGEDKDDAYTNDDNWSKASGLAAFGSNLYVLDRGNDVLKLVAGSEGFGVTSYFKGEKPKLSDAQDLAIDSSIYILMKDGSIQKYTKGEKDSFSIAALQKPMQNPTRIVTGEDLENIYVLDPGNSRVVKLDKSGTFKDAYSTPLAAKTKAIDVDEAETKIYLLSGNKIYELSM